jgi:hypothetical protein
MWIHKCDEKKRGVLEFESSETFIRSGDDILDDYGEFYDSEGDLVESEYSVSCAECNEGETFGSQEEMFTWLKENAYWGDEADAYDAEDEEDEDE